jgi:hypothetical protein
MITETCEMLFFIVVVSYSLKYIDVSVFADAGSCCPASLRRGVGIIYTAHTDVSVVLLHACYIYLYVCSE